MKVYGNPFDASRVVADAQTDKKTLTASSSHLLISNATKLDLIIREFDPKHVKGHVTGTCNILTTLFLKAGEKQTMQGMVGHCGLMVIV
jgi:hypothetical protein